MKTNVLKFLGLAIMLYLSGCEGKQGEVGPAGKDGTNGTNGKDGVNGTNGVNGNANVVYSDWITPDYVLGSIIVNNTSKDTTSLGFTNKDNRNQPLLTKEAIDKAVIYTYIRHKKLERDEKGNNILIDAITNADYYTPSGTGSIFHYIQKPNTDALLRDSFTEIRINSYGYYYPLIENRFRYDVEFQMTLLSSRTFDPFYKR